MESGVPFVSWVYWEALFLSGIGSGGEEKEIFFSDLGALGYTV